MSTTTVLREDRGDIAFDHDFRGYRFTATYLHQPKGDALIEISKGNIIVRAFLFPAYKIWNIAAHADDIVDGLERDSDSGLFEAGSLGPFGGNAYKSEQP